MLFLVIVTCSLTFPTVTFAEGFLTIGGTGSALPSMKILGEAFKELHPRVTVKVLPSLGSTGGIKAVAQKAIDLGISSRVLDNEEGTWGLSIIEYAKSPLVFVANKNVTISNITPDDIVQIYNGNRTVWPDGQRIRTPLRQSNETDVRILKTISPEISVALDVAMSRPGMVTALTDQDNADMIERIPGAFGISTLTQIISEKRCLNILSFNGVMPNINNLASDFYPLSRLFFAVTLKDVSTPVREFLTFMQSTQGRRILKANGYVALSGKRKSNS
jgi:phosphate transport system substrate-binding protein